MAMLFLALVRRKNNKTRRGSVKQIKINASNHFLSSRLQPFWPFRTTITSRCRIVLRANGCSLQNCR